MSDLAVSVRDVSHAYGSHTALQNVSFDVPSQAFFGLLGPNGSGKTTLFRILTTLMPPDRGQSAVLGFDTVLNASGVRERLGMIFQQPSLDEELTVRENLVFHGRLYGIGGQTLSDRIEDLAERLQVADRLADRVKTLSGGLKRRADLVRGILHRPEVLLLDEPTTALDPAARHSFWQLLNGLRHEEKLTLVLATHLLEEAEACEKIVILDRGRVVARGNPDEMRDELGEQVLWITSDSLNELAGRLESKFGFTLRKTPEALGLAGVEAIDSLPRIYASAGELIESATLRRPSLEDVFLSATGRAYGSIGSAVSEGSAGSKETDVASEFKTDHRFIPQHSSTPALQHPATLIALWKREIIKFIRDRSRLIGALAQPLVFWLLLGLGFQQSFSFPVEATHSVSYLEYLFPGIVALMVLFTAIFSTISIVEERKTGFLQAALVAPVSRVSFVVGTTLGGTTLSFIQAGLLLLFLPAIGITPSLGGLALLLTVTFLMGLAFTALGVAIAWVMDSTRGFHAIMNLFLLPLWMISGAFFPSEGASRVLQWIIALNPVSYAVSAIRTALYIPDMPIDPIQSWPVCVLVTAVFAALMVGFAVLVIRRPLYK